MQPWFVRENKWRAARYGLDATVILDSAGNERPVTDDVRRMIGILAPVADRLGCRAELEGLNVILENGANYQRQRKVADAHWGSLPAIVTALSRELESGLPR